MQTKIEGPLLGQSAVCTPILRELPDWFGIESEIEVYSNAMDALPVFLARVDGELLGFLCVKQHFPQSAELYVMGVREQAHHQGLGRALVNAAEDYLRQQGVEYFQVKTLGPSHPDPSYAKTRAFYLALGFRPVEEFTQIWDENNPCLILIKSLL